VSNFSVCVLSFCS
jgi:hypothetical protein